MSEWIIRRLASHHVLADFDCGEPSLDRWIREYSGQDERRGYAITYVATRPDSDRVWGYHAIASHSIEYTALPEQLARGLPSRLQVPVLLLARFATDRAVQRQGLGKTLLGDAYGRSLAIARRAGIQALVVDALTESAKEFYIRRGFTLLQDRPLHLIMTLKKLRKAGVQPIED